MIARLAGMLAEKAPGRVIVDVQGVGYDLQVPLSTFYVVGELGAAITLRVHTLHVHDHSPWCLLCEHAGKTSDHEGRYSRQVRAAVRGAR